MKPVFSRTHDNCPFELSVTQDDGALNAALAKFDPETGELTISTSDAGSFDGQSIEFKITMSSTLSTDEVASKATDSIIVTFKDDCHNTELSAATTEQT